MAMTIIGVMGGGSSATAYTCGQARRLGELIANEGWVLLTGGRNAGVMDAASQGAKAAGGLTVGVLPDAHKERLSEHVDIPIVTGMGNARNVIQCFEQQGRHRFAGAGRNALGDCAWTERRKAGDLAEL